ncbi:MAG: class I SAM-dependent methyltransferase [bacterium]
MAEHACPVWIGYLLASPARKLLQDPHKILMPYIRTGMKVLDIGCAMGFFSLPMAQLAGTEGQVICVDLQEKMLAVLRRRARCLGLLSRIRTRTCGPESLGIDDLGGQIDFAFAFAVVHEVKNPAGFFSEVYAALRPGGRVLFAEPKWHVRKEAFEKSVSIAEGSGLRPEESLHIPLSHALLLSKPGAGI